MIKNKIGISVQLEEYLLADKMIYTWRFKQHVKLHVLFSLLIIILYIFKVGLQFENRMNISLSMHYDNHFNYLNGYQNLFQYLILANLVILFCTSIWKPIARVRFKIYQKKLAIPQLKLTYFIKFDEKKVIIYSKGLEYVSTIYWDMLDKVIDNHDMIAIHMNAMGMIPFPRRWFDTEENYSLFIKYANTVFQNKAHNKKYKLNNHVE